jgi:hypothetical protein
MYMNRRIQAGVSKKGTPLYRDVATVWLEHVERRQFLGGVVMDPTCSAPADAGTSGRASPSRPRRATGR